MRLIPLLCLAAACGGSKPEAPAPTGPAAGTVAARPAVVTMRSADVNGTRLAYRIVGDTGSPVVFVHGSLADWTAWDAQVASFAAGHRVLVYSRRYHYPNRAQDDSQTYSPMLHAEDLAALLLSLELAPAHIVGADYGAYTALVLAQEHPEVVRSLALAEPPLLPFLTHTQAGDALRRDYYASVLDAARAAFARGDSIGALRAYVPGYDALPVATRTVMLRHAFELRREMLANREEYLPPLTCADLGRMHTSVLLLSGARSTPMFHAITDELGRCLSNDTTAVIPSAGHGMQRDQPPYYNAVVLRFLATH